MSSSSGMVTFMNQMLQEYKSLRGKKKDSGIRPFWDVVVITTADEDQRQAFQLQIDDKASRNELPVDLPICVVTDPPGTRIGNGGSTLTSMEYLYEKYGEEMYKMKVLLIHAGGWSQRMPSASVLGKVFSALPHGDPLYQMLDLKLAMYWPLVDRVKAGVLLVCADDFLVYDLGPDSDWSIPETGFTCLAHPSPIEIGRTHGVYVLSDPDKLDKKKHVSIVDCLEVLQKPTDERMEKRGAVLGSNGPLQFADDIVLEGKVVYTDSSFYFGTDIMRSLLNLKKKLGKITCEIDAYGDFLQSLGPNGSSDYISLTGNISTQTPDLLDTRKKVYDHLHSSDIHLLVMNASKFIHIGTTKEYIEHLCQDKGFQEEMSFSKHVFSEWTDEHVNSPKKMKIESALKGCLMHSSLPWSSSSDERSVIEYCQFDVPISVGRDTILSNCQYLQSDTSSSAHSLRIPDNCFLHTVPVKVKDKTEYVTICLGTFDNVKKSCSSADVTSLPFVNKTIKDFCSVTHVSPKDVLPNAEGGEPVTIISLWNLRLFSSWPTMTSSLEASLSELNDLIEGHHRHLDEELETNIRYSMADLLKAKDVATMLNFRRSLYERIIKNRK